jgi:hypothetical protein
MTPPSRLKPAVRYILKTLGDLRILPLSTAVNCNDVISIEKPSLVGKRYGLVAFAVPVADRGESSVEDGDMT